MATEWSRMEQDPTSLLLSFPTKAEGSGDGRVGCDNECYFPAKTWWAKVGNCNNCHLPFSFQFSRAEAQKEQISPAALMGQSSQIQSLIHGDPRVFPIPIPQPVQDLPLWFLLCTSTGWAPTCSKAGLEKKQQRSDPLLVCRTSQLHLSQSAKLLLKLRHTWSTKQGVRDNHGDKGTPLQHPSSPQTFPSPGCP